MLNAMNLNMNTNLLIQNPESASVLPRLPGPHNLEFESSADNRSEPLVARAGPCCRTARRSQTRRELDSPEIPVSGWTAGPPFDMVRLWMVGQSFHLRPSFFIKHNPKPPR